MDDAPNILALESRRKVFDLVRSKPGVHLREISREAKLPLGTAVYHLECLQRAGVLVARQDGRYKRWFTSNDLGRREKDYAMVLRRRIPRAMLKIILAAGTRTQRSLAAELGVSRSTLSAHAKSMVAQGVLRCEDRWPENLYSAAEPEIAERMIGLVDAEEVRRVPVRPRDEDPESDWPSSGQTA